MLYFDSIFDTEIATRKKIVPINTNFVPRKGYQNKQGLSRVYLHITGHAQRKRLGLDLYLQANNFCNKKQRLTSKDESSKVTNLILDNYAAKIASIKTTYHLTNKELDVPTFVEEFVNGIPRVDFVAFALHYLSMEKGDLSSGTYRRYTSVLTKLREYKTPLLFTELDHKFLVKYKKYLFEKKKNSSTTIASNIAAIKKFLNAAKKFNISLAIDPDVIKPGNTKGQRVDLNRNEVRKLVKYLKSEFISDSIRLVLGYFLFGCFNGLRISEIQSIERNQFSNSFYEYYEQKNKRWQRKNINDATRKILQLVPELFNKKFTNEYLNREIKKIVRTCGITKKVTFHTARHTFATNYLRMGGSVVKLRHLLNHSDIKQTMIYVHIVEQETNNEVFVIDSLFE